MTPSASGSSGCGTPANSCPVNPGAAQAAAEIYGDLGGGHYQNQRKVSTSSSVASLSPKRARMQGSNPGLNPTKTEGVIVDPQQSILTLMPEALPYSQNEKFEKNSAKVQETASAAATPGGHFTKKTWQPSTKTSAPSHLTCSPASTTSTASTILSNGASVMDLCNKTNFEPNAPKVGTSNFESNAPKIRYVAHQQHQRPPRTFYGSNHGHYNAYQQPQEGHKGQHTVGDGGRGRGGGRFNHGYHAHNRGGYHRHGAGGQFSQMPGDVQRRPRTH